MGCIGGSSGSPLMGSVLVITLQIPINTQLRRAPSQTGTCVTKVEGFKSTFLMALRDAGSILINATMSDDE